MTRLTPFYTLVTLLVMGCFGKEPGVEELDAQEGQAFDLDGGFGGQSEGGNAGNEADADADSDADADADEDVFGGDGNA